MFKHYQIPLSSLRGIFLQFSGAVKKGWNKLEYSSWRKVNKWLDSFNEDVLVSIVVDEKTTVLTPVGYNTVGSCPIKNDKCGFTGYLLKKLEEPEMTTNTSTGTIRASDYVTTTTNTVPDYNYVTTACPTYTSNTYTINSDPSIMVGDVKINKDGITIGGKKVKTEEDPMTTKDFGLNFDFGPVTDNTLAVCPFGIAAKNPEGGYCYYDPKEKKIMDCTPFTFDTKKFLFKMPVTIAAVTVGDVIMHRGFPMFVKGVEDEDGRIMVIDIAEAEEKYILPTRNMFGFDFVTKVVSFMDMKNTGACADNPFGNMLPLLMLMKDDKDLDPMMLLMMNGGQIGGLNMDAFTKNPLMMYMMMKDNKNLKDMLPFLMMTSTMPVQR